MDSYTVDVRPVPNGWEYRILNSDGSGVDQYGDRTLFSRPEDALGYYTTYWTRWGANCAGRTALKRLQRYLRRAEEYNRG